MIRASLALALGVLSAIAAGCKAAPLPAPRALESRSEREIAWDSRACAWAAQDASGYDPRLAPGENRIVAFFIHGQVVEPTGPAPDAGGTSRAEATGPAVTGDIPRAALGRGGRKKFDQVYAECMTRRGYELSSLAQKETRR